MNKPLQLAALALLAGSAMLTHAAAPTHPTVGRDIAVNPQPLPPLHPDPTMRTAINPQPLPRRPILVAPSGQPWFCRDRCVA